MTVSQSKKNFRMNKLITFAFLTFIFLEISGASRNRVNLVVGALREVVVQQFAKVIGKVDIYVGCPVNNTIGSPFLDTIASDLLRQLPETVATKIFTGACRQEKFTYGPGFPRNPSIFLFETLKKFRDFLTFLHGQEFEFQLGLELSQYLVFVPELTNDQMNETFSKGDYYYPDISFLSIAQNSSIDLTTIYFFAPRACDNNQIRKINRYSAVTQRWDNSSFYLKKFENFNNCSIEVIVTPNYTSLVSKNIYDELARRLNFNIERVETSEKMTPLTMMETAAPIVYSEMIWRFAILSAVKVEDFSLVSPPGMPMTDFERMFAAFDKETWIGIGATFVVALLVIRIINFMSMKVQNFIFGRGIRTPTLNLFAIFLTGAQHRSPGRNFARFILTLFMLWSLIFRTCYQSMMFQHLNSDLRHPRPKTIEELKEQNFTFVAQDPFWFKSYLGR